MHKTNVTFENLYLLEKKLAAWTRLTPEQQLDWDVLSEIYTLAEASKSDFLASLEQCDDLDILQLRFNSYHRRAIRLINLHAWPAGIDTELRCITAELTACWPGLLHEDEPLPRHEKTHLQQLADRHIPAICMAIEHRNLPKSYCHEIRRAFRNLFDDTQFPELTYRHKAYIPRLLTQGLKLTVDKPSKRWNAHLLEFFVNYNFNYMGIFERWKDLREAEFGEASKNGKLEVCLRRWEDIISHYNPRAGMAFDPQNDSLHSHMQRFIGQQAEWLRLEQRNETTAAPAQLFSKLVGTDLRVRFHYFFQTDYDYEAPKDAAKDYSGVHVTRRGETISPRQLLKFDKEKLFGSARKFRRLLVAILKRLDADFGFKNTDF